MQQVRQTQCSVLAYDATTASFPGYCKRQTAGWSEATAGLCIPARRKPQFIFANFSLVPRLFPALFS